MLPIPAPISLPAHRPFYHPWRLIPVPILAPIYFPAPISNKITFVINFIADYNLHKHRGFLLIIRNKTVYK